ncbi:SAG family member [Eimeria brunetti]|uniref:SAG family member n=1 Tax=Eimeria brunetti TaxID=51314 RepID=U6LAN3_9EIME|nr:SAG family member [Eimeria brunetti]
MAPLYKAAAAVCLAALAGLQSEAAQPPTYKYEAVKVDDAAYVAANLARNGKLAVHITEVTKDEDLVTSLGKKLLGTSGGVQAKSVVTSSSCSGLIEALKLENMFRHSFEYQDNPNYRELFQAALDDGLQLFKSKYPSNWETIWQNTAGANLAYLLGSTSTKIACVVGKCTKAAASGDGNGDNNGESAKQVAAGGTNSEGTETKEAVLFCELDPAATRNEAPFNEEYFNALISRTDKLTSMTADDLKAPANNAPVASPVLAVLMAGLVAMLAAVSA